MKVIKVYRVHAYNAHINKQLVEWYTSLKEVKLRAIKLVNNGFEVIDDFHKQEISPVIMSFSFTPDDTDLSCFRSARAGKAGSDVTIMRAPAFGCPGVVDICITCTKLQTDGHCAHEEIVGVEGCSYYDERR